MLIFFLFLKYICNVQILFFYVIKKPIQLMTKYGLPIYFSIDEVCVGSPLLLSFCLVYGGNISTCC